MASYSDLIHEAIHAVIHDHDWPVVTTEHRAAPEVGYVRVTTLTTEKPTGLIIDQSRATFGDSERHRRSLLTDRQEWFWEAKASWRSHVNIEEFEISLQSPIIITRELSGQPRQITLRLLETTYQSPVRQQSTSGSRAQFRFVASLSPL